MSFHCKACTGMPIDFILKAIKEAIKKIACDKIDKSGIKSISKKGIYRKSSHL